MNHYLVYVTTPNLEQAKQIGRTLVEERLAACVNLLPHMASIYWWHGKTEEDEETVLLAKTQRSLLEKVVSRVKDLHSYDCPCVVALPIAGGSQAFLDWIQTETSHPPT